MEKKHKKVAEKTLHNTLEELPRTRLFNDSSQDTVEEKKGASVKCSSTKMRLTCDRVLEEFPPEVLRKVVRERGDILTKRYQKDKSIYLETLNCFYLA
jgi:hypothetical protein